MKVRLLDGTDRVVNALYFKDLPESVRCESTSFPYSEWDGDYLFADIDEVGENGGWHYLWDCEYEIVEGMV